MKEIKFVDVGEGITEGHIRKWLVKDGAEVKEDQPLFQVETDKAVVNMPAPIDGTVKIFAKEDTTVKLGDTDGPGMGQERRNSHPEHRLQRQAPQPAGTPTSPGAQDSTDTSMRTCLQLHSLGSSHATLTLTLH